MRSAILIGLCFLVAICEGYDLQVMGVVAPRLRSELGLAPDLLGYAFSATTFGLAIGAIVGGRLSDRFGRKPVLVTSVFVFGVFTLATAFSYDFNSLFLVRLATGLGLGGAMPNLIAIASEATPRSRMTTAVGMMFGGLPVGAIGVAVLARYGSEDWRTLFYVGGWLPILLVPVLVWLLPETHERRNTAGQDQRPRGVLTTLFAPSQWQITLSLWLAFVLTLLHLYVLLNWLPSLVAQRGLAHASSTAAIMLNVGSLIGAMVVGRMCDRWGVRRPMLAVYGLMAISMLALTQVTSVLGVVTVSAIAGFSVVGAQFALYGLAPHFYDETIRGTGVGAAVAAGRVGSIIGPAAVGVLLSAGFATDHVILATVPAIALGGAALAILTYVGEANLPGRASL